MTILRVKNVTKHYGKKDNLVKALDGVDLTVEEGEFIAITGASGSGKSTLLHCIGSVDIPTSGEILISGEDIHKLNDEKQSKMRRSKIGLIYQFYNLIPTLNVEENIVLPSDLDKKVIDKEYYKELIDLLGLNDRLKHLPSELSGGQQQRVAIARALINRPALLLADEPTGNLDSKNSIEIMELLVSANKKYNQTIIMVTHDMNLAKYANRIISIEDGKIINDKKVSHEDSE
ncbi:MAG: ABC transporter ATP-binding protein [Bacilli bacterium]|nr:ABC transporter ATP-binding protein [Bacilli bacterium]